jgi:hypothetical protein
MPHLVLEGRADLGAFVSRFTPEVQRWGRAVLKLSECWSRSDGDAVLVEGVVVELARPLHPVVHVACHQGSTRVRLWPAVEVERTPAVQRLLALVAAALQECGCSEVTTTNLKPELLEGVDCLASAVPEPS